MPTCVTSPSRDLGGRALLRSGRTQWPRIRQLSAPGPLGEQRRQWEDAWRDLVKALHPTMLAIVTRTLARMGGGVVAPDEAEDVVQSFLLACLENDYLARANPELGRFRTFLSVCLHRHTTKYVEHRRRLKRAPRTPLSSGVNRIANPRVPASAYGEEPGDDEGWFRSALAVALRRVESRSAPNAKVLRMLLATPDLDLEGLALRLDEPRPRVALRLHRARRMLAEELWEVVKLTATSDEPLRDKKAYLSTALSHHLRAGGAPSFFARSACLAERP